jgi:hypothetical protein
MWFFTSCCLPRPARDRTCRPFHRLNIRAGTSAAAPAARSVADHPLDVVEIDDRFSNVSLLLPEVGAGWARRV